MGEFLKTINLSIMPPGYGDFYIGWRVGMYGLLVIWIGRLYFSCGVDRSEGADATSAAGEGR